MMSSMNAWESQNRGGSRLCSIQPPVRIVSSDQNQVYPALEKETDPLADATAASPVATVMSMTMSLLSIRKPGLVNSASKSSPAITTVPTPPAAE